MDNISNNTCGNDDTDIYLDKFSDTIPYQKIVNWKNKSPSVILNEYCQYTNREWSIYVNKSGSDNCPVFTAYVTISGIHFKPANSENKKGAKAKAAKLAMEKVFEWIIVKF
nr:dsRNA-binding [Wadden Sea poxvirus]